MDREKTHKKLRFIPLAKNLILNATDFCKSSLVPNRFDEQVDPKKAGNYDYIRVFAIELQKREEPIQLAKPTGKYDAVLGAAMPKERERSKALSKEKPFGRHTAVEPFGFVFKKAENRWKPYQQRNEITNLNPRELLV